MRVTLRLNSREDRSRTMSNPEEFTVKLDTVEDFGFDPQNIDSFDLGLADLRDQDGINYPCILLSGVAFMDCLRVLSANKRKSYREVDAWLELENSEGFKNIGTIQLDSDLLLLLKYLRIRAVMYYDAERIEALDLNDPQVIEKFI